MQVGFLYFLLIGCNDWELGNMNNKQHSNIYLWFLMVMPLMGCFSFGYSTMSYTDVLSGEQSLPTTAGLFEIPHALSKNRAITPFVNFYISDIYPVEIGFSYDWTNGAYYWDGRSEFSRNIGTNKYTYAGVGMSLFGAGRDGDNTNTVVAHCRAGVAWESILGIYGFQARLVLGDTIEVAGYDINTTNVQILLTFVPTILTRFPPNLNF